MGFWKHDAITQEIVNLENEFRYATSEDDKDRIMSRLRELYALKSERNKDKMRMRITGDGVLKCVTAIGLAGIGFLVEHFGGILPKWTNQKL